MYHEWLEQPLCWTCDWLREGAESRAADRVGEEDQSGTLGGHGALFVACPPKRLAPTVLENIVKGAAGG